MKKQHNLPPMHLICSNDDIRFSLHLIQIKDGIATATDAHVLVRYDLKNYINEEILAALNGKCIHKNTWIFLTKNYVHLRLIDNEVVLLHPDFGVIKLKVIEDKFCDYESIIKAAYDDNNVTELSTIGLNTELASKMQKVLQHGAFKSNHLIMRFMGKNKSMLCYNTGNTNAIGVIMPVMVDSEILTHYSKLI